MLSQSEQAEVIRVFQQMMAEATGSLADEFERIFRELGSWDIPDSRRFIQQSAEMYRRHKQVAIDLTSEMLSAIADTDTIGLSLKQVQATPPNPDVVFRTMWQQLSDGDSFDTAFETAAKNMRSQAVKSVRRVSRETTRVWVDESPFRSPWDDATDEAPWWRPSTDYREAYDRATVGEMRVVGYRRVLTGLSCRWCARVATQRYLTADSADFGHPNCDCDVVPMIGDSDPGQLVNRGLYDQLRADGTDRAVDRSRTLSRLDAQAANADRRRRQAQADYDSEDDSDRRDRIRDRMFEWDEKATKYRAQAADMRTANVSVSPSRYVNEAGRAA